MTTARPAPMLRSLVVEDDPMMRGMIEEMLRERGHRVQGVGDAETALAAFAERPADLLLVDWTLPGMDGLELCRRIRALPNGEDPVIVMITGRDSTEDQMSALDAGANDYVTKPFEPELLSTRVLVAERQLKETMRRHIAEARERQISQRAPGMLYQLAIAADGSHLFTFVSEGARQVMDVEPADVERDAAVLTSRLHPDDRAAYDRALLHAAQTVAPMLLELRVLSRTGATRWVRITASGELSADGGTVWNGLIVDITDAKLAEDALRRSETTFRRLIEAAPDAVAVIRGDRLVYVNAAYVSMLRYDGASMLVGQPLRTVIHKDDLAGVRARMTPNASSSRNVPIEYRQIRRDGSSVPVEATAIAIDYEGGPATLTVARDVSEVRQMRARLMQADRMASIGMLAAGVAHELNNPLGYVLTNLRVLQETLEELRPHLPGSTAEEVINATRETRDGAERMRMIVRDLRTFSRAEDEAPEATDVERVLESCIKLAGNELKHRARLERHYQKVSAVRGNENRLGQVFLNLVVNAVQAFSTGGPERNFISIRTRTDARGRVCVDIQDNGRGIPADHLDKIFDPLFTTKPGVGSGLGLPIAHSIVTSLGGHIEVLSQEGRGATFTVVLPATSDRPDRKAQSPLDIRREGGPRGRVLVIDDEPLVASALQRALRQHDVVVACNGREGIARLTGPGAEQETFDVVLCDLMMPDVPGPEVFDRVRSLRPELEERFVFMTGGAFTPEARAFLEHVRNERIEKPFDVQALRQLVAQRVGAGRPARTVR